jgi:hypothetical protein
MRVGFTLLFALCSSCASTGATFRSGVGDKMLEHPPWFAGASESVAAGSIGHFPVAYQRGATQAPQFEPEGSAGSAVGRLLGEMNRYLDSLRGKASLDRAVPAGATPPDVQFGCLADPTGDCNERGDSALGRGRQAMRIAVGRPSPAWIEWAARLSDRANVTHTLVLTIEVSHYLVRQRGVAGNKEVELGTGYTENLPWLTSLETPVAVVQVTGALMGPEGRAVRIGAEGILARRTSLGISSIGGQELVSADDIERLLVLRRADLPDTPLAWQVALRNLIRSLTGE